ncbi:MAG: class I SAM-dependent methyltransferase [Planctomycetota bacterium]
MTSSPADDPTRRFSDRATDYAQSRPGYPDTLRDALLRGLESPVRAADVGAGTGIGARWLADADAARGVEVVAVEPNAAMRAAAAPHRRVAWQDGSAERTGLDDQSVDVVLCAQAFHWFATPVAVAEFARVLRPGGRLALLWNRRDDRDPCTAAYGQELRQLAGEAPAEAFRFDPQLLAACPAFAPVDTVRVPGEQCLDRAGLLGRALSASYVPKDGPVHDELLRRLDALHARFADGAGTVTLRYTAELHLATRRADALCLSDQRPAPRAPAARRRHSARTRCRAGTRPGSPRCRGTAAAPTPAARRRTRTAPPSSAA